MSFSLLINVYIGCLFANKEEEIIGLYTVTQQKCIIQ